MTLCWPSGDRESCPETNTNVTTHLFEVQMASKLSYYGVLGAYPSTLVAGEDGVALSLSALSLLWHGEKRQDKRDLKKWIR